MTFENLYAGNIVENICDTMIDYDDCEKEVLEAIKKQTFSIEDFTLIALQAAFVHYMEVLNYCLDIIPPTKKLVSGVLESLLEKRINIEYSSKDTLDFIKILEKVDSTYIDLTYDRDGYTTQNDDLYSYSTILHNIYTKGYYFEPLLNALYQKAKSCFTVEIFDRLIKLICIPDENIQHLVPLKVLLRNEYFSKLSDKSKDTLISKIFYFIQLESDKLDSEELTKECYSFFVEFIKSKGICVEYFQIAEDMFLDDSFGIEDNIKKYSEDILICFFKKTNLKFENVEFEEYFLYASSALGYTKLIDKFKNEVYVGWLNDMLFHSLKTKHFKTSSYLLKTFGIINFEISEDLIDIIKIHNYSKVLLVLLKSKRNLTNIDWKEWFKDVNEFSAIIETYCHDVIFSIMPCEYQNLLMELMEQRKGYVNVQLSEKCKKFKEVALDYGFNF